MSDELKHYGMPRRSGRYPWGSGKDPYQRAVTFRSHIQKLRQQGLSDTEIAKREGIKTTQLRARISLAKDEQRAGDRAMALKLKDKGYSNMEIARRMSGPDKTWNESSIRSLLDPVLAERAKITKATVNMLKEEVNKNRFIDIGAGIENHIGVSRTKLNTAVAELQEQGYKVHTIHVNQLGMPGKFTIVKALGTPDTEWKEIVKPEDHTKIKSIASKSDDFGRTYKEPDKTPIKNVDSKRVKIRYAEDGGSNKDGLIELRRGVDDLDLGNSKYAQVRISVDGTHFIKGMAVYSDELPKGTDILFNTNKSKDVPMMGPKNNTVLKPMKDDPDNPFGATIKEGGRRGALNIVNEEGDWDEWSRTISSQVLSKQTTPLAKAQLNLALKQKQEEYDEIMALTNPVVKKQLLLAFADDCDSSAVHLKAAALPRQASKVILPIPSLKENEIYAPTYNNGEKVVLIRHPHGGRFEIPEVTVNNKSKEAQAIMKGAKDAIGIHPTVAKKLSGADFDGDTVIVIPNNKGLIKTAASLRGLKDFDPIRDYKIPEGSNIKPITPKVKQTEMGKVSNLITDMTIKGANLDEICKAVKHSMVVIDSEKHNLDYRQSYKDNEIATLSEKYQNSSRGGASTLISKASSEIRIDDRRPRKAQEGGPIDPETGKKVYTNTGETYTKVKYRDPETGKIKETSPAKAQKLGYSIISSKEVKRTTKSTRMAEVDDAFELSSGRPIEEVYASYANSLKSLGNTARKNALATKPIPYNPSSAKVYAKEVDALNSSLNIALMNKPLEREAQMLANSIVARKQQANPYMDADDLKKERNRALADARTRTGAKKNQIEISDKQWEAIQAGAVSPSRLSQILQNTNLDRIKQLATPRTVKEMSATKIARAKDMASRGFTQSEIAESLGVSVSALSDVLD
jgi:biotin operon repressor